MAYGMHDPSGNIGGIGGGVIGGGGGGGGGGGCCDGGRFFAAAKAVSSALAAVFASGSVRTSAAAEMTCTLAPTFDRPRERERKEKRRPDIVERAGK